jgi:antitoxin Phd
VKKTTWQLQNAKNRFSELVKEAEKGELQIVTKNGKPVVCIIDIKTYDKKIAHSNKSKKNIIFDRPHKDINLAFDRDGDTGRDLSL